jgi:hypothetical protein
MATPLLLEPGYNPFTHRWEYYVVQNFYPGVAERLVVPRPFSYDGATVPWFAQLPMFTPYDPQVMRAACVHDWLYTYHVVSRERADQLLRDLLIDDGLDYHKAWAIHRAVRTFGRSAWANNKAELAYVDWLLPQVSVKLDYHLFTDVGDDT